jgi:hypothetical protein
MSEEESQHKGMTNFVIIVPFVISNALPFDLPMKLNNTQESFHLTKGTEKLFLQFSSNSNLKMEVLIPGFEPAQTQIKRFEPVKTKMLINKFSLKKFL